MNKGICVNLTVETVKKVAHLARIQLSEEEAQELQPELNRILEIVDAMSAVDTSHVQPIAHPLDTTQRFREDVVSESDQRTTFQAIAPKVEQDLYLVPKVIE
jgi:aspartyl-tRNA(Asn)/glutamyl-tRNA(Gln) amidotransferase subunit C